MKKINFMALLLSIGILPVLLAIVVSTIVSVNKLSNSLESDVYSRLTTATTGLKEYYRSDLITKGEVELDDYVDSLVADGIELTLFEDDTRVSTSIYKDGTTERNVGTKADSAIYQQVKAGNIVKKDGVTIGGHKYYVVYQPIYDANNQFWGMSFAGESQESVEAAVNNARNSLILVAIIAVVTCGCIIVFLAMKLRKPMADASKALTTLSTGSLEGNIQSKSAVLEISNMIEATSTLQKNLQEAIGSVKESSSSLTTAVTEVDEKVEGATEGVGQISSAIEEVAGTSQTVATSAQTLADKADALGQDVEALTANVEILTKASDEIKQANDEASKYMLTVLESSNDSVNAVNNISKEISDTNDAVADIQSCVAMINEIASETKLLSLNASIEAARAGEAGRGFAVVAQNIKQLAESSSDNVKKITDIINKVTDLSAKSVKGAEDVKNIITNEQKYIKDTQSKFEILSKAVDNSIEEIHSISDKTVSLDKLKAALITETSDLGAVSEELGASAQEVAATCSSVNSMCQDNRASTEEMRAINETLAQAVSFFK